MILYPVFYVTPTEFVEDDYENAEYAGSFPTRAKARRFVDEQEVSEDRVYYVGRPIEGIPLSRLH